MKPKIKKTPSFTEARLHDTTCVHYDPKEKAFCTAPALIDKPNGFLCWEHDRQVFPINKTVQ